MADFALKHFCIFLYLYLYFAAVLLYLLKLCLWFSFFLPLHVLRCIEEKLPCCSHFHVCKAFLLVGCSWPDSWAGPRKAALLQRSNFATVYPPQRISREHIPSIPQVSPTAHHVAHSMAAWGWFPGAD